MNPAFADADAEAPGSAVVPPLSLSSPFIEIAAIRPPTASSATATAPTTTGMFRLPPPEPEGPAAPVGEIVYGGGVCGA